MSKVSEKLASCLTNNERAKIIAEAIVQIRLLHLDTKEEIEKGILSWLNSEWKEG